MSSLKEIVDIIDKIMSSLTIIKLVEIDLSTAKKIFKLKDKQLNNFVKSYNEAIKKENLTYFSKVIDNKYIILSFKNGEFYGTVTEIPKERKFKKNLCYICDNFRTGDEIYFVTNTSKKATGEYNTIGQYCCSDYQKCNKDIIDSEKLIDFLSHTKKYEKKR